MTVSEHRLSLGTAIRYASAAGMATQRAQRAFLAHRKAKRAGLILPAAEREKCTNDFRHRPTLALLPSRERCRPGATGTHERIPARRFPADAARSDRRHSNRSTEPAATGRRAIWPTSTADLL